MYWKSQLHNSTNEQAAQYTTHPPLPCSTDSPHRGGSQLGLKLNLEIHLLQENWQPELDPHIS